MLVLHLTPVVLAETLIAAVHITDWVKFGDNILCSAFAILRYKPDVRGFDFRLGHWIFKFT
jgi:hypothetical protein